MPATSLPPPGSVTATPIIASPLITLSMYLAFCCSFPNSMRISTPKKGVVADMPSPGSALHSSSMVTSMCQGLEKSTIFSSSAFFLISCGYSSRSS